MFEETTSEINRLLLNCRKGNRFRVPSVHCNSAGHLEVASALLAHAVQWFVDASGCEETASSAVKAIWCISQFDPVLPRCSIIEPPIFPRWQGIGSGHQLKSSARMPPRSKQFIGTDLQRKRILTPHSMPWIACPPMLRCDGRPSCTRRRWQRHGLLPHC